MNEPSAERDISASNLDYEKLPRHVYVLGGLLVLIGLGTFYLMTTGKGAGSYLYLFLYAIPSNAAISVFPHEPVLIYYGTFANIWISGLVATGGTIVASFLDYQVFVPVVNHARITSYKEKRWYQKAMHYFIRFPFATIAVVSSLPLPFFPIKFLAFSDRYPYWRYVTAISVARFPRYVLLAWFGAAFGIPGRLLIGIVVVIFAIYLIRGVPEIVRRVRARRQAALALEQASGAQVATEISDEH